MLCLTGGQLQSVCSESASFDLPAGILASCVQEVQSALEIALVRREDGAAQRGGEIFVAGAGTCPQLHLCLCFGLCSTPQACCTCKSAHLAVLAMLQVVKAR